jgi:hypothetical protein
LKKLDLQVNYNLQVALMLAIWWAINGKWSIL